MVYTWWPCDTPRDFPASLSSLKAPFVKGIVFLPADLLFSCLELSFAWYHMLTQKIQLWKTVWLLSHSRSQRNILNFALPYPLVMTQTVPHVMNFYLVLCLFNNLYIVETMVSGVSLARPKHWSGWACWTIITPDSINCRLIGLFLGFVFTESRQLKADIFACKCTMMQVVITVNRATWMQKQPIWIYLFAKHI